MHGVWYLVSNSPLLPQNHARRTITSGSEEQHVTISFRQSTQCGGQVKAIELKSIDVLKGGIARAYH